MNQSRFCIVAAVFLLSFASRSGFAQPAQPAGGGGGQKAGGGNQSTATPSPGYSAHDSIPQSMTAVKLAIPSSITCPADKPDSPSDSYSRMKSYAQTGTDKDAACVLEIMQHNGNNDPAVAKDNSFTVINTDQMFKKGNAIVLHVMEWTGASPYQPVSGTWGFYRVQAEAPLKLRQFTDLSGTPYFYAANPVYLVDINVFDTVPAADAMPSKPGALDPATAEIDYTLQSTPLKKQNQTDLATLLNAVLKTAAPAAQGGGTQNGENQAATVPVWGTIRQVQPSDPTPYSLSITSALGAHKQNANGGHAGDPSATPAVCAQAASGSQTPCSFAKSVTNYDREYWDVSLGLATPGPTEVTYKSTTSSGTTTITPTKVVHTDAYAFFDFYLFQALETAPAAMDSHLSAPHINFGIPITSQPLHRPYVGLAEDLGFLTHRLKINLPISVYFGAVFMKQQVEVPGTTPTLVTDWAAKKMFGLEISISSIASYLKSSSSGGGGGKSGGSTK